MIPSYGYLYWKIINILLKRNLFLKQANLKSEVFSPKQNKASIVYKYFKSCKNKKSWKVFAIKVS